MKIGILTYHRTNNYGACLQAVATRLFFEQMGHKVYYIDYWPSYHADKYKVFAWSNLKKMNLKGKIQYILNAFTNLSEKRERIENFNNFLDVFIIPYCKPVTEEFDIILYGSDQIWRKQSYINSYNPIYFGKNNFKTKSHIAFASSMGLMPKTDSERNEIRELVSHLDYITVREDGLKDLLFQLGYTDVCRIVDPTLLLTGIEWVKQLHIPDYTGNPYLLIYYVTKPAFDMNEIRKFAEKKGLEIKILCGAAISKKYKNIYSTADPVLFLQLFRNADYTFVSSFHGLAFSIIFHKEVYASYFNNSNRAETLLKIIGASERLLKPKSKISELNPLDYFQVERVLLKERQQVVDIFNSATNLSTRNTGK